MKLRLLTTGNRSNINIKNSKNHKYFYFKLNIKLITDETANLVIYKTKSKS